MTMPPDLPQQSAPEPPSNEGVIKQTHHSEATPTLFDALPTHHNAPNGTSEIAAQRAAKRAPADWRRILNFIRKRGAHGATDDEGERELRIIAQTYTPQRRKLAQDGLIFDSGKRRKTLRGCPAAVWIAAKFTEREE